MLKREVLEKTLGKGAADAEDELFLDVSPQLTFSRRDMTDVVGCSNWNAIRRLNKILKEHSLRTPAQLYAANPMDLADIHGFGDTCMKVVMCLLDFHKYSVTKWWGWKQEGTVVKFSTFKARQMAKAKKRKSAS